MNTYNSIVLSSGSVDVHAPVRIIFSCREGTIHTAESPGRSSADVPGAPPSRLHDLELLDVLV